MDKQNWEWNESLIVREVIRGCELAKELQNMLHLHPPPQIHQYHLNLTAQIVNSFARVLELLNGTSALPLQHPTPRDVGIGPIIIKPDHHSPPQEILNISDNQRHVDRPDASKRRKGCPRRSVRVSGAGASETGSDGPPDDGYSWRKYGQKDILGSHHPRSYYRCTHKTDVGCEALKQVQRAYDDPSCFEVTYIGFHSCHIDQSFVHPHIQSSFSVPASVLLGGCASQSESCTSTSASAGHERGFLTAIPAQGQMELAAAITTMSPLAPAETDARMDFSGLGNVQQDDIPPATILRQDKSFNFIDFLPQQPKQSVDPAQYYGDSVSPFMNVDSGESMAVATSSPLMLDLDIVSRMDDASEIQLGENLPWNIKQP